MTAADGTPLANACRASRKDVRDAVRAARKAAEGWAAKTAMNRGQVLYRVAELMEGRRDQFADEVAAAEGLRPAAASAVVDRAIDRWVWYAGWADKIGQVLGSSNPVAAPYFNFTIPEPTGVVGVVAPETSSLLGLVSRLAPPLVTGNAVVLIASERRPLPAITLTEVLATSDVPGGVVNVLTGRKRELVPVLAAHGDVDALDTWGVPDDLRTEVETLAADDIKRLLAPPDDGRRSPLRLARRRCRRAPRMDRRLPRDEDGLAPDRRLTMAVGTGGTGSRRASPRRVDRTVAPVERRVFVHATPRTVWATLHDPGRRPASSSRSCASDRRPRPGPQRRRHAPRGHVSVSSARTPASRASRRGRTRASGCG